MVPDYGKSQCENHSYSKTRLPDYHDSAANVTNSRFYFNLVTISEPIAASKEKHPVICDPIHENNITCCALSIVKTENWCIFCYQRYSSAVGIFPFEL